MKLAIIAVALGSTLMASSPAFACTGIMGTPVTWVRDADVIARVRASEEVGTRRPGNVAQVLEMLRASGRNFLTTVRFEVLEVLKGERIAAPLAFEGELLDRDDPNDRPAPYNFVRPLGRSGNCFAFHYKQGGEYLLLLRSRNGSLTPYWATLGATNEQLFGSDDKWLTWVRERIRAQN
jgi:hypothetical protein